MTVRMIPGYRHRPGNHCGSTALRNLLAFDGIEISEEMALGLGAGVSFFYVALDGGSPSRFINGRTARLEEQFVELTRSAYGRHSPRAADRSVFRRSRPVAAPSPGAQVTRRRTARSMRSRSTNSPGSLSATIRRSEAAIVSPLS